MFNAKKDLETLRRKYARLQEECKKYQAEAEVLRDRLFNVNAGEHCKGGYCESCKHSVKGGYVELLTSSGNVISVGENTICKLAIPCQRFEMED